MRKIIEREATGLYERPPGVGEIRLPTTEVARTFAVETIDYPHPLGVHQVNRWINQDDMMNRMDDWCPEWKMCSADYIKDV
jgi:hypothetical protein